MSSAMMSERLLAARDRLEHGEEILHVRDLLLADEDVRVLEDDFHALGIGDEVRREVAAVELHALDHFERRLRRLALLDGDDAFLADLLHRLGELGADLLVAVGADRADVLDLLRVLRLLRELLERLDDGLDGLVDAALDLHRVVTGGDELAALAVDRLREDGGGRGAVAGDVARLRGHFAHHLGAHVLEAVLELDLLGDRDAVLGHRRRAEALLDDDVAALGAERDLDRVGQGVDAGENQVASVLGVDDFFGSHFGKPLSVKVFGGSARP